MVGVGRLQTGRDCYTDLARQYHVRNNFKFLFLFLQNIGTAKMRTPKHKRIMQKAKTSATNKLRKKAMKNKMMKKTMLDIGGDDTRDEVRDLMNESDLSLVGVVSHRICAPLERPER